MKLRSGELVKPGPGWDGPLLRLSPKGALEAEFDTGGALVNIYAVRPNGRWAMEKGSETTTSAVENANKACTIQRCIV